MLKVKYTLTIISLSLNLGCQMRTAGYLSAKRKTTAFLANDKRVYLYSSRILQNPKCIPKIGANLELLCFSLTDLSDQIGIATIHCRPQQQNDVSERSGYRGAYSFISLMGRNEKTVYY